MHLKNGLRQIKANCANFTHGRLLFSGVSTPPLWHIDAVRGASTPSLLYRGIRQRQFCASSPLGVGSGLTIG
jgi:hypothetical protein